MRITPLIKRKSCAFKHEFLIRQLTYFREYDRLRKHANVNTRYTKLRIIVNSRDNIEVMMNVAKEVLWNL